MLRHSVVPLFQYSNIPMVQLIERSFMGKRNVRRQGHTEAWKQRRQIRRAPPPESELWPEWCRGELWEPAAARWFLGRCQLCAYSCQPSERRRRLDKLGWLPTFLLFTNHPDSPGRLRDVIPTERCRNFKVVRWQRPRSGTRSKGGGPAIRPPRGKVCRIPLGHGLFAAVDARDYKRISKYKWYVSNKQGMMYAMRRTREGKTLYMHHEIMRAPKGTVVDRIDHNTLNNRRSNLRRGTAAQNYASAGPRGGTSGYVGVYPRGKHFEAGITWRGRHYNVGKFDDPVEAAKARDRKAYE